MSRAINPAEFTAPDLQLSLHGRTAKLWPVLASLAASILLIGARLYIGPKGFLYEGALTMLALISYICAAVLLVTNLFVKEQVLSRLGVVSVSIGVCFNFSGWMIRWIEAGDAEGWRKGINGFWRYFPLDNLYSLTLGFCFGAGIATLVIIRNQKYQFLGALSMPIVVVIQAVAMLLGNEISTLPPILDSYWRPVHVSIATIGYGVCLVSFGLAFAYLLKDGIGSEVMAIAVALFGLLVCGTVGRYGVLLHAEYGVSLSLGKSSLPVRAVLPGVGPLMAFLLVTILGSLLLFIVERNGGKDGARRWGWRLFRGAAVLLGVVLGLLFFQLRTLTNPTTRISERELAGFGAWLSEQMQMNVPSSQYVGLAKDYLAQNGGNFTAGLKSNPIEIGGLLGLFIALLLVVLFSWKRKELNDALPPLQTIDALLYRTVGVAFPLLSLLLITGAVWANESWGRYWGWDSKEVGALVAWMAYAAFLHTRIAHGWQGRRSAYFALLGFALVIFTWLGVSYLLPGLHSYA